MNDEIIAIVADQESTDDVAVVKPGAWVKVDVESDSITLSLGQETRANLAIELRVAGDGALRLKIRDYRPLIRFGYSRLYARPIDSEVRPAEDAITDSPNLTVNLTSGVEIEPRDAEEPTT